MIDQRRTVVITGMGVISVIGNTLEEYWQGLLEGRSGVGKITLFDASEFPCQIAGELNGFNPGDYMSPKEARRTPKSSQIALAAAMNAVKDSGLPETMPNPERAGIVIGTAISGIEFTIKTYSIILEKGYLSSAAAPTARLQRLVQPARNR
jgi:3-oxoacyl-[acyl-carrier-protein] synthase II